MQPRAGAFEGALLVAATVTLLIAGYVWRRRDDPGVPYLLVVLAANAGWTLSSLVGSLTRGSAVALLTARLTYLFVPLVVTGVLLFVLEYIGRESGIDRRLLLLLAVEPVAVNVAAWTNPGGAFWTIVGVTPTARIGWEIIFGPLFYAHVAYSYALVVAATAFLIRFALRANRLYQQQIVGILASMVPPWVSNVWFVLADLRIDPTPIAFSLTGIGLGWAIARAGLLNISPVARDAVVETIDDAVLVVDEAGSIVDSNDAATELFGTDLVSTDLSDSLPETARALVGRRERKNTDVEMDDRYFTVTASPLYDIRDQFLGQVFVLHDVTERKRRRLELSRRNEQLDQFASVVSHDLRNPLSVASGRLELARETGEERHFERVADAHERMELLVEDLLTLARKGNTTVDIEPVELESVTTDAWATVDTGAATLLIDGDTTVDADAGRLRQLLENLFRNAVEHGAETPDASDLTVTVTPTADGFSVADDGVGLDGSTDGQLFDAGVTTAEHGTGFGLAIVDRVAEQHDWSVAVTDCPNGGVRFDIDTRG